MTPPISPNALTALRLPLAPIAVIFMIYETPTCLLIAAILAFILEMTDIADGQIARRYGIVTDFGKLFDPFSDAFCRYTLFLGFYAIGVADLWMIMVIFYRDSSIAFFRSVSAIRETVLAARPSGKIKAVVQGVGIQLIFIVLLLPHYLPELVIAADIPWWTMCIITIVTLISFVDYARANTRILRRAWQNHPVGDHDV